MTVSSPFSWDTYLSSKGVTCSSVEVLHDQRNEVVRVHTDRGRELLLKRGTTQAPSGEGTLLNEGLVYQVINDLGISDLAPRCILHDRANDILLLEYVRGRTVRDCWLSFEADPHAWASLGSVLAQLHAAGTRAPEWSQRLLGAFEELVPSSRPLQPQDLVEATPGQLQIVRVIHSEPLIGTRLAELASATRLTLIHGDARFDNILVQDEGAIRLIDFELSRIGDPLFDMGTLGGSIIEQTATSSAQEENEKAAKFLNRIVGLAYLQVRSVIAGYRATARALAVDLARPEDFLSRLSGFVGVYLLHRAGAMAHQFHAETRMARLFTIVGCSFLRNPALLLRPLGLDASYNWLLQNRGSSDD